jgi:hypothetical protein
MAALVVLADGALPALAAPARLAVLIAVGALSYAVLLGLFARGVVIDAWTLIRREPALPRSA